MIQWTQVEVLGPARERYAVIDLCPREGSAAAVGENVGVSRPSLYPWKTELLGKEAREGMNTNDGHPSPENRASTHIEFVESKPVEASNLIADEAVLSIRFTAGVLQKSIFSQEL